MGSAQSTGTITGGAEGAAATAPIEVYQAAIAEASTKLGVKAGGYFGGDEENESIRRELADYRISAAAAAKDRVVMGLGQMAKQMQIKIADDAKLEDIARALETQIPNPRKNGKAFKADAAVQEKACRAVATALNNAFTPGAKPSESLINPDLGAVAICRKVGELVHSMATGVHTEFLEVHQSLERSLEKLTALDEILDRTNTHIGNIAAKSDLSADASKDLSTMRDLHMRARKERDRQIEMIKQILKTTVAPTLDELKHAMRSESETYDLVKSLDLSPGSKDFSDQLSNVFSGLGSAAHLTARVDKALRKVGLTINDYRSSEDMKALEKALDANMMTGDKDLGEFLRAAQVLRDNFARRDEMGSSGVSGGSIDKRVESAKTDRKLIVKRFIDKTASLYSSFLKEVQEMGPRLGREIPLSDKLGELRSALLTLRQSSLGNLNVELALIGYYSDADARARKSDFLAGLTLVKNSLDDLQGMSMYSASSRYMASMSATIGELIKTIEFFSDEIARRYGGDEHDEVMGGDAPEELKSLPEIKTSMYNLELAISSFLYFFFAAKVRSNLKQTQQELEVYGEDYEQVLGDAVAARLRTIETETAGRKKQLDEDFEKMTEGFDDDQKGVADKDLAAAKAFLDDQLECKKEFYRVIQGLDIYMKVFTEKLVANPDDIADIKRMLDSVQFIASWFDETSGDNLAKAFDSMPGGDGAAAEGVQSDINSQKGEHYYNRVATSTKSRETYTPGIPQVGVPVADASTVQGHVSNSLDHFQALKNITNAFARLGDKFGGKEIRREVFMNPTQMYNGLMKYMKCSALSLGTQSTSAARKILGAKTGLASRVFFGSAAGGLDGDFATEDMYFVFCVKAMAAKILTVLGVYDLFERPRPVHQLTPTRMIIGGSEYDMAPPEVIPEAAELYMRLPRLAEFYKDLFKVDSGEDGKLISILPEVEGVFSGLIRTIFVKIDSGIVASGDYSEMELRSIIREINSIYQSQRRAGGENLVNNILNNFVMEINRRYGVIKAADYRRLQALLGESYGTSSGLDASTFNRTNYAILPGEEESMTDRRAPSDRFQTLGSASAAAVPEGKHKIDDAFGEGSQYQMLTEFRKRLDKIFDSVDAGDFTSFSFATVIRQGRLEIERASSPEERLEIASRLIQGSGSLAGVDVGKSFMFHETVVVGLNVLNALRIMIERFRNQADALDITRIQKDIKDIAGDDALTALIGDKFAKNNLGGLNAASVAFASRGVDEKTQIVLDNALDRKAMMGDLLVLLSSLTCGFQKLVTLRFPQTATNAISVDFSNLRSLIQTLMANVRYFLDVFRPHVSKETLEKFEGIAMDPNKIPGSFFALEKSLIDEFINPAPGNENAKGLEWMSRSLNNTYVKLIEPKKVDADGSAVAPTTEPFGSVFAAAVFFDKSAAGGNSGVDAAVAIPAEGIQNLIQTSRPTAGAPAARPGAARAPIWTPGASALGKNRSLMFTFNQLLAKYIGTFYDPASGKIYRPLIDGFANGAFSRSVMNAGENTFNDIRAADNLDFGQPPTPATQDILFRSLAYILQRLVVDVNPSTQISDHLVATMSELPLYTRESFRANLPTFIKLFELVQKEGELYKSLLAQTKINVATDDVNNEAFRQVLTGIIDSVSSGCYTISTSAADVLREMSDQPLYLQTGENSIENYRARYNEMPLMPISSALTYLRGVGGGTRMLPVHQSGSPDFKLMYGTRGLLGRPNSKFSLADAPGVRANLETFNSTASEREKIDAARYDGFLGSLATALRFIVDTRFSRGALAPEGSGDYLRNSLVDADGALTNNGVAAYQVRATEMETLSITESSAQKQEMQKISDVVGGAMTRLGTDREKERIFNIIDMNIMPINVHALMRGIPLAPLYNYSYTFDQMTCLMFGQTASAIESVTLNDSPAFDTRSAFLKLITDPLTKVSLPNYGFMPQRVEFATNAPVQRLMRGDDGLGMGRPKFISDQLLNKVLFGTQVPSSMTFDQAGPAAAGRTAAGLSAELETGGTPVQTRGVGDRETLDRSLTYLTTRTSVRDTSALRSVKIAPDNDAAAKILRNLQTVGRARFDTNIVRQLFFITNIQRVIRAKLARELTQFRNVLATDYSITNRGVTEYGATPPSAMSAEDRSFGAANESLSTRRYDNDMPLGGI